MDKILAFFFPLHVYTLYSFTLVYTLYSFTLFGLICIDTHKNIMRLYFFRMRDRFSALLALQVDWVVCLCTCKTWLCFFVVVKVLSVFYLTNHIALPHPPFIFSSPIRPPSVLLNLYALKWAFIIKFLAPY